MNTLDAQRAKLLLTIERFLARRGVARCKLCLLAKPLRKSHIFPDFYIRRMQFKAPTGQAGCEQPFLYLLSGDPTFKDGAKQGGHWEWEVGLKERILCQDCEEKFSKLELFARRLLYGTGPGLIIKKTLGDSVWPVNVARDSVIIDARRVLNVDYVRLKLFQLSLIWRAGVAGGRFFRGVKLGATHEEELRRRLHDGDPGSDLEYACPMLDLRHNDAGCEDFLAQPVGERESESKQRIYKVVLGGYLFIFHVTNQLAPLLTRPLIINQKNEMVVFVAKAEGILRHWNEILSKAGRL